MPSEHPRRSSKKSLLAGRDFIAVGQLILTATLLILLGLWLFIHGPVSEPIEAPARALGPALIEVLGGIPNAQHVADLLLPERDTGRPRSVSRPAPAQPKNQPSVDVPLPRPRAASNDMVAQDLEPAAVEPAPASPRTEPRSGSSPVTPEPKSSVPDAAPQKAPPPVAHSPSLLEDVGRWVADLWSSVLEMLASPRALIASIAIGVISGLLQKTVQSFLINIGFRIWSWAAGRSAARRNWRDNKRSERMRRAYSRVGAKALRRTFQRHSRRIERWNESAAILCELAHSIETRWPSLSFIANGLRVRALVFAEAAVREKQGLDRITKLCAELEEGRRAKDAAAGIRGPVLAFSTDR
jgi:hypothetical protein